MLVFNADSCKYNAAYSKSAKNHEENKLESMPVLSEEISQL